MPIGFVTGANGFLGLNLVEQLCANGWTVFGLCRPGEARIYLDRFPITVVEADITEPSRIKEVMPKDLDAVFHTAAMTSIWSRKNALQLRVNVEGTRNVTFAALAKNAKRLVHTSTWNTYGTGRREISETAPQHGGESWVNYVRTKFLAEEEVRAAARDGLATVILNPGHLMGRYDVRNWGRIIRMVHDGKLPGIPRAKGAFCHAEAVARAHITAAQKGRTGENYLLPGIEATFKEVIEIIGELTGNPVPTRTIPIWFLKIISRVKVLKASVTGREPDLTPEGVEIMFNDPRIASTKAKRELSYEVVPLKPILEDAVSWMKRDGLLE